jgi:hypothetical protein
MPVLGYVERPFGRWLAPATTGGEGTYNLMCAAQAAAVLAALAVTAAVSTAWIIVRSSLGLSVLLGPEGVDSWCGQDCC